jgi:hypothetical protein
MTAGDSHPYPYRFSDIYHNLFKELLFVQIYLQITEVQ